MDRSRPAGRDRQKARTRRGLLEAAGKLLAAGRSPSVAEVADAADVSRRTAYRYFPTQEQLHTEAALETLRSSIEDAVVPQSETERQDDPEARLDRAVRTIQRSAIANEPLLRTMVRLTVTPSARTRPDPMGRRRGYRRIEWIELALEPVRKRLGKRRFDRLVRALTLCIGIEALIVLRDLHGLSEGDAEAISRWAARALLRASLDEKRSR